MILISIRLPKATHAAGVMEILEELYARFPTEKDMKAASHLGATEFSSEQVMTNQQKKIDVQVFGDETTVLGGAKKKEHLQKNATVLGDAGNGCYGATMESFVAQPDV